MSNKGMKPPLFGNKNLLKPNMPTGKTSANPLLASTNQYNQMMGKKSMSAHMNSTRRGPLPGSGANRNTNNGLTIQNIEDNIKTAILNNDVSGSGRFNTNQSANRHSQETSDYWRGQQLNYNGWKKEEQQIHKNKKVGRPISGRLSSARQRSSEQRGSQQRKTNADILPALNGHGLGV